MLNSSFYFIASISNTFYYFSPHLYYPTPDFLKPS
nr:MAG TPA: peptidase [Caudoviricetes sp.]